LEQERGGQIDAAQLAQIDAIFFAASNTQQFANDEERSAFRERWLGRYLDCYREHVFVALDPDEGIIGYLVGCLDDPARTPLFSDIGHSTILSDLTERYPAHLHINLDAQWRNRGIGAQLIEAFCMHATAAGSPGMHVVTGDGARNVRFYERCGFRPLRSIAWNDAEIVLLGRNLQAGA
jgi:GNAT superfamily N-acetyltransferase